MSYNKLIEFEWNYALKFVVLMAGDNWHPLILLNKLLEENEHGIAYQVQQHQKSEEKYE